MPVEEVVGGVRNVGHLSNKRAWGRRRFPPGGVHALDEGRVGENARTFRDQGIEPQPRDGICVHRDGHRRQLSNNYAAAVALPGRVYPRRNWYPEVVRDDIAIIIE